MNRTQMLIGLLAGLILTAAGCAKPYKVYPPFYSQADEIKRIAVYPLIYAQDGKDQRLFGMIYDELFHHTLQELPMEDEVRLEPPMTVLGVLDAGNTVYVDSILVRGVGGALFPAYRYPTEEILESLYGSYDAVVVAMLIKYTEVSAEAQLGQMCLSACLTGGMIVASQENSIQLDFTLVSVGTRERLWSYRFASKGEMGVQRVNYSRRAAQNFGRYFPLSTVFEDRKRYRPDAPASGNGDP